MLGFVVVMTAVLVAFALLSVAGLVILRAREVRRERRTDWARAMRQLGQTIEGGPRHG